MPASGQARNSDSSRISLNMRSVKAFLAPDRFLFRDGRLAEQIERKCHLLAPPPGDGAQRLFQIRPGDKAPRQALRVAAGGFREQAGAWTARRRPIQPPFGPNR